MINTRRSFTLIELLVVLAIVAILSVVVILTLNPSELLKQARDSTRLSDLSTVNTALGAYNADVSGGGMGTSSVVYVSISDTTTTCANLGLPSLPTGYTYNCVTQANLKKADGTGWIPVNFNQITFGSPLSNLPVDPVNTTTTGNYYTYVSGGSWILTALPESARQKTNYQTSPAIKNYPGVIAVGNNTSLSPLYNSNGLVGYWTFDEGSGTVVKDSTGQISDGTITGAGNGWVVGKIGLGMDFNAGNRYITIPNTSSLNIPNTLTVSVWLREVGVPTGNVGGYFLTKETNTSDANYALNWYSHDSWCPDCRGLLANMGGIWSNSTPYTTLPAGGGWHLLTAAYDSASYGRLYVDGVQVQSQAASGVLATNSQPLLLGSNMPPTFHLTIDDLRIYNRVLSASEVAAIYNATK